MSQAEGGKVVGVIPARGGSKGLPHKNILPLGGKPVLAYTIEAALAAKSLDRVILSTDSQEIADIGKEYGAEVPFLRPLELAESGVPLECVFQHAITWLEDNEGYKVDVAVLLEVSHPFRPPGLIDRIVNTLVEQKLDSVS